MKNSIVLIEVEVLGEREEVRERSFRPWISLSSNISTVGPKLSKNARTGIYRSPNQTPWITTNYIYQSCVRL